MITPSSTVRFLNVPFSPSQNNIMKFPNVASQIAYMESTVQYTLGNCTYLREEDGEYLRVNKVVDALYNCNYVMFQNKQFGDRWFYGFIEKLKYKNPNCTDIVIKLDVMQTFMFDYTIPDAFIERQTQATDYYNTLADTPATGDLKCIWEYEKLLNGFYIILFNSDPTKDDSSTTTTFHYPVIGTYSMPCFMAVCTQASEMSEIVQAVSNKGRADRIQSCYFVPSQGGLAGYEIEILSMGDLALSKDIYLIHNMDLGQLTETITLDVGITPIFKKELSYPYAKLEIVDKITGKFIELDLSKFTDPLHPQFMCIYNITDTREYKFIPLNYNGIWYGIENALVVTPNTDLPIFANSYAKYLKNNEGSNVISGVMAGIGAVSNIATGNVGGAISSFGSIANIINSDHVARTQPNQVSGIKGDAFDYQNYNPSVYFRVKIMDNDHMKIARNFWNAYGYPERKISTFSNTSQQLNFIKTVGVNIIASTIPAEFQKEIENILDNGVTFWNSNYLNYNNIY